MTVLAVTMVIMVMRRNGGRYQIRHFSRLRCDDCDKSAHTQMSRQITRDKNQRASGRSLLSVPQILADEDVDASVDDDYHQFPVTCPRATNTADFTHGQRYHHHHCHHNIVDFCQTRDLGYFDDSEADRGFSRKQRPLC